MIDNRPLLDVGVSGVCVKMKKCWQWLRGDNLKCCVTHPASRTYPAYRVYSPRTTGGPYTPAFFSISDRPCHALYSVWYLVFHERIWRIILDPATNLYCLSRIPLGFTVATVFQGHGCKQKSEPKNRMWRGGAPLTKCTENVFFSQEIAAARAAAAALIRM